MRISFSIIILLLVFSCKNQDKAFYEFNPTALNVNPISLSDLAEEISYIPLDNSFPVGRVFNYNLLNNSIYLSAKDVGILSFRIDGNLHKQIGGIGRGPGEYTFYNYFTVDDEKGTIYVLDRGNIIKVYSKEGEILRSFSLQEYGDIVDVIDFFDSKLFVSFFLQTNNSKYDYAIFDTLGNLIKKEERTLPPFTSNWQLEGGLYKFNNTLNYWNPFSDTVSSIYPDLTRKASFIISPGIHRFPRSKFDSFEEMRKYLIIERIFETKSYIILKYVYKDPFLTLVEKKGRKSHVVYLGPDGKSGIVNDLDGGTMFLPESYFVENGREYLIGITYPSQVKIHVTTSEFENANPKYPEKKKELEKLANSLKETDNPILMVVRLKK